MSLVEMYRFVSEDRVWTVTSADVPQSHGGEDYEVVPIGRGATEDQSELARADLDVRLDLDHELSQLLLRKRWEHPTSLTLFRRKPGELTAAAWKGRLVSHKPEPAHLVMTFESIFTSLRRPGLRATFQRSCRHALYGRGCKLDPEDFGDDGRLTEVDGVELTVPEAGGRPSGWFSGGMVRTPDGILRFVIRHVGDKLTLQRVAPGLAQALLDSGYGRNYGNDYGGLGVRMYPGCDRSRVSCDVKFGNLDNNGAFYWIPTKNPQGGSSIV